MPFRFQSPPRQLKIKVTLSTRLEESRSSDLPGALQRKKFCPGCRSAKMKISIGACKFVHYPGSLFARLFANPRPRQSCNPCRFIRSDCYHQVGLIKSYNPVQLFSILLTRAPRGIHCRPANWLFVWQCISLPVASAILEPYNYYIHNLIDAI